MLKINISGCKNKKLRDTLKQVGVFVCNHMMSKRLVDKITIYVKVWSDPHGGDLGGDFGDCVWEDDPILPREFTINLSTHNEKGQRLSHEFICKTFIHELVHVKQHAKGEGYWYQTKDQVKWKGKIIKLSQVNYWDYPWEWEAYGGEMCLYELWKESLKNEPRSSS